jgi:hypothetical protein
MSSLLSEICDVQMYGQYLTAIIIIKTKPLIETGIKL